MHTARYAHTLKHKPCTLTHTALYKCSPPQRPHYAHIRSTYPTYFRHTHLCVHSHIFSPNTHTCLCTPLHTCTQIHKHTYISLTTSFPTMLMTTFSTLQASYSQPAFDCPPCASKSHFSPPLLRPFSKQPGHCLLLQT